MAVETLTYTCKLRIMLRLDFKQASEIIRAVDAELETLLNAVWGQAAKARQRDLCSFLAKYPYKHFVFKNGRALDPDGRPLRSDSSWTICSKLSMKSYEAKK